jgi:hypothetical protein
MNAYREPAEMPKEPVSSPWDKRLQNARYWISDHAPILVMVVILTIIAVFLMFMIRETIIEKDMKNNAPCEAFASWSAHNVPARCLKFYGTTTQAYPVQP